MNNARLHDLLNHCIAEATAEHGPEKLAASEIYADMARRILGAILEDDAGGFETPSAIMTVRVTDIEAWLLRAFESGREGWSSASVSWELQPVGWIPRLHVNDPKLS